MRVSRGPVPHASSRRSGETGSATVLVVAATAGLLVLGLSALALVGAVRAAQVAHSGADLAALAGAGVVSAGGSPTSACSRAGIVAAANGAHLTSCVVLDPADVEVRVVVETQLAGLGPAVARARAGPGDGGGPSP